MGRDGHAFSVGQTVSDHLRDRRTFGRNVWFDHVREFPRD